MSLALTYYQIMSQHFAMVLGTACHVATSRTDMRCTCLANKAIGAACCIIQLSSVLNDAGLRQPFLHYIRQSIVYIRTYFLQPMCHAGQGLKRMHSTAWGCG